jgi:pilus assembly protein Flp/PilA
MELIKRFFVEQEGADAAEYALVIGLVALAIVVGAMALGGQLSNAFNHIGTCVNTATNNAVPAATC